ncbi:MAG: ATP-binding protein [Polyangiaceae bacterium]
MSALATYEVPFERGRLAGGPAATEAQRRLLELTAELSEPRSLEDITQLLVDHGASIADARTAALWSVADGATHAELVRTVNYDAQAAQATRRLPLAPTYPLGAALVRGEAVWISSLAEYKRLYPESAERLEGLGETRDFAVACLPLVVEGRAIAGMSLVFTPPHAFDDDERLHLMLFARHGAQALARAKGLASERIARARLEKLQSFMGALSSAATVADVAQVATRRAAEALGVPVANLWLCDHAENLVLTATYGVSSESLSQFAVIPRDSDLPGPRTLRTGQAAFAETADDIAASSQQVAAHYRSHGWRSYAALPLRRDGEPLGVLVFSVEGDHRYGPGERAFMATIAHHCTEALARARLYERAQRAERRLKSVLEDMPIGVLVGEAPRGRLVLRNEAAERIWRRPLVEDPDVRYADLRGWRPDGTAYAPEDWPLRRALELGEHIVGEEVLIERGDGTRGWMLTTAAPVRGEGGAVDTSVVTLLDVTAQKEAEEEARRARAEAELASRAKDDFLAMLGHELRNPLSPIVTALHLMRLRGGGALARERAVIERQVQHLVRLVDDLLDVSRAVHGKVRLDRRPMELARVVAEAIEVAAPLLEERRHELKVEVPEVGLVVDVDAERIAQVVSNLLSNAAKYTPVAGHIVLVARRQGDEAVLEVRDDGDGITPELLPRVFELFTQGRQGIDRKKGGLGLGLAIARQLVVQHGGSIEARSAGEERGTTMTVRLPCLSPAEPAPPPVGAQANPERPARSRRVLVVDDNVDAADTLGEAMELAGHEVRIAHDGPSALEISERFAPEIAFLDIGLPVMDGYELAAQMRRLAGRQPIVLVAVTGYTQSEERARARAHDFDEHLAKPVDLARAIDCVSRAVSG